MVGRWSFPFGFRPVFKGPYQRTPFSKLRSSYSTWYSGLGVRNPWVLLEISWNYSTLLGTNIFISHLMSFLSRWFSLVGYGCSLVLLGHPLQHAARLCLNCSSCAMLEPDTAHLKKTGNVVSMGQQRQNKFISKESCSAFIIICLLWHELGTKVCLFLFGNTGNPHTHHIRYQTNSIVWRPPLQCVKHLLSRCESQEFGMRPLVATHPKLGF